MSFQHIIYAVLVAAIWGFNFIVVKVGLGEIPPLLYNSALTAIASLPLIIFVKKPSVSWHLIFWIGICFGVIKLGLLSLGIRAGMAAGLASLILQSQAFFTLGLSIVLLGEKISKTQLIGMLIAFVGILLIGMNSQEGNISLVGFLFVLVSAFFWGICNILTKKAGNVDMFALVIWTSIIPPLPLYFLSIYVEGAQALPQALNDMTILGWNCLLFSAWGAIWVGYTLWGILLRTYEASLVAPFSLLIPVFGISFSHILLKEQFTPLTYGACGLVFLGLIINQRSTRGSVRQAATKPTLVNIEQ